MMRTNRYTYIIWLTGVIAWNYGFPTMPPIADVIAAVTLSMAQNQLVRRLSI
jgi:hypothetical protein